MNFKLPLLPGFWRPRLLVVDCGARHVACGWFTAGGGRLALRRFAFEPHSPEHHRPDADWMEATAWALGVISRREKFGGTCRLALPGGHHLLVKFVRTPSIAKARRGGIIAFEAQQNIPCPLAQVAWDHLTVADDGTDLDLMLAAVKSEVAGAVHHAAGRAGFHAARMVPSCIALLRAFRHNHPDESDRVLVAEIGARTTHLIFIEGERFFIRTVLLGGDTVTQAVADALYMDFSVAETLKIEALSGHLKSAADSLALEAVRRATTHFTNRLHLEIVRSTITNPGQPGRARPLTVYLAGGGSLIPELPVMLADKLTVRVVRFETLRHVTLLTPAHAGAEAVAPMLADLVGLATSLIDAKGPELNLLPASVVRARAARRRRLMWLAMAVLTVAAPLPVIRHYQRVTTAVHHAAAEMGRRLQPHRVLAGRNADNLKRIAETKRQIAIMQNLIGAKSSWVAFLNDLQERLAKTEDVWLEKLQFVRSADGTGPAAPSSPVRRLALSGRLLDQNNPVGKVSPEAYERVGSLLQLLGRSPFVSAIENEHFDNTQPGILRFDCTLVLNPQEPL